MSGRKGNSQCFWWRSKIYSDYTVLEELNPDTGLDIAAQILCIT